MHRVIEPKILYVGTPVVLVSTLNADGSANLAPMSSVWWLGSSAMIGMSTRSHTFGNLAREQDTVINLPSDDLVDAVDRLALTTGSATVPDYKLKMGYRHVTDKFALAGVTPQPSHEVAPPRVAECPLQVESRVAEIRPLGPPEAHLASVQLEVVKVHAHHAVLSPEGRHYVDPNKWRPLIMNFLEFYGLGGQIHPSRLAQAM